MANSETAEECFFCTLLAKDEPGPQLIDTLDFGAWVAIWDGHPVSPGHALVLPKRHVRYMHDLSAEERLTLIDAVASVKKYISSIDLAKVYLDLVESGLDGIEEGYVRWVTQRLAGIDGRAPEGFNDGINDGPVAGQTVPHFHWHIIPRWRGDMPDPRGGVRCVFPEAGNYRIGAAPSEIRPSS